MSSVGPVRNHDAANNSDGQVEAFGDSNASSQSGDESRSQSMDTFPSPLGTQHKLLYHTPELGHARILDRSPTPAGVLAGYGGSASSPYLQPIGPSGYAGEPALNEYAPQVYRYGEPVSMYYGCSLGNTDIRDRPADLDSKMKNWHPFGAVPSGAVGTALPSPSSSASLTIPSVHHMQLTYSPHAPSSWSKAEPTTDHPYDARPAAWGTSPLMPGHHSVDSQAISPLLPSSVSGSHQEFTPLVSANSNALGIHPHGNSVKNSFEENHYRTAYAEVGCLDHLTEGSHPTMTPPPFQDGLPQQDNSSSIYLGPTRWPGEHAN
jgi:hypothetical protein